MHPNEDHPKNDHILNNIKSFVGAIIIATNEQIIIIIDKIITVYFKVIRFIIVVLKLEEFKGTPHLPHSFL